MFRQKFSLISGSFFYPLKLENLFDFGDNKTGQINFLSLEWNSPAGVTDEVKIKIPVSFKKILSLTLTATNGKNPRSINILSGGILNLTHWDIPQNVGQGTVYIVLLI